MDAKLRRFKYLKSICGNVDDHQKRGEIIQEMIAISKDIVADTKKPLTS